MSTINTIADSNGNLWAIERLAGSKEVDTPKGKGRVTVHVVREYFLSNGQPTTGSKLAVRLEQARPDGITAIRILPVANMVAADELCKKNGF